RYYSCGDHGRPRRARPDPRMAVPFGYRRGPTQLLRGQMVAVRKTVHLTRNDLSTIRRWLKDKENITASPGGASLAHLGKAFEIEGVELVDDAAVQSGDDVSILFSLLLRTTLPDDDWRSDAASGTVVVRKSDKGVKVRAARIESIEAS